MLTDDLIQLAKAYKSEGMQNVKKIYDYIEKQSIDDQKQILATLRVNKFNSLIVDVFLNNDGSIQEKNDLAYQVSAFNHPGIIKKSILEKLVYDQAVKTTDKTQFLLLFQDENMSTDAVRAARQLYDQNYFSSASLISDDKASFTSFKNAMEIYKKVIKSCPGLHEVRIISLFQDIPLSLIAHVYDQAIDEYGHLSSFQIDKIDCFLLNEIIRKFRSDGEIKEMGTVYIHSHLDDEVYRLMSIDSFLKKDFEEHLEIIDLYNQSEGNIAFFDLILETQKCLEHIQTTYYIELLKEIMNSDYNEDTMSTFKSQVKQGNYENACNWLNLLHASYCDQFDQKMEQITDTNVFIEYLLQIKENYGNCELKPNTLVKKFTKLKSPKTEG